MDRTVEYRDLAKRLLQVEDLEDSEFPLPDMFGDPPRLNIGDLSDEDEQRLCCEVAGASRLWRYFRQLLTPLNAALAAR